MFYLNEYGMHSSAGSEQDATLPAPSRNHGGTSNLGGYSCSTVPSFASQPYYSLFLVPPPPNGNKEKYGWLTRLHGGHLAVTHPSNPGNRFFSPSRAKHSSVYHHDRIASFPGPAQLFVPIATESWAGPGNEANDRTGEWSVFM